MSNKPIETIITFIYKKVKVMVMLSCNMGMASRF